MKNNWYVGIDVSKKTLDVSVFKSGTKPKDFLHKQFDNSEDGIKLMIKWLRKECGMKLRETSFCMEYTGCYSNLLRYKLDKLKVKCHMVAPLEMRMRSGVAKVKNDKLDSARIADYLARYNDVLSPTPLPSKNLRKLDSLIEERRLLVSTRTSFKNRVQTIEFDDMKRREEAFIKMCDERIEMTEAQMVKIIESDEELKTNYDLLVSISGIGPVNAIVTIVNTENFTAFETAREYASYVGVAPHRKTSGKCVRRRHKPSSYADLQAKADLSMAADAAIRCDDEFRNFFNRKTETDKSDTKKRKVMNAIKFKLILRMFAVVRKGKPYQLGVKSYFKE